MVNTFEGIANFVPMLRFIFFLLIVACSTPEKEQDKDEVPLICSPYEIYIDDTVAMACYTGPEFLNGEDIGHQLSNYVADSVGRHLKSTFEKNHYKRVVLDSIAVDLTFISGDTVTYTIQIPFEKTNRCHATTCIDHRGSWVDNRRIADAHHKEFIQNLKKAGYQRIASNLFTSGTLYEYWVIFNREADLRDCD
jgi:hypothetical protein